MLILTKGWYVTRTLLACEPDTNLRFIYYANNKIAEFRVNQYNDAKALDALLDDACRKLNAATFGWKL